MNSTLTNVVAAARLHIVTISLMLGTQTGHRVPCSASTAPGSQERGRDDD